MFSEGLVRRAQQARKLRSTFFGSDLFTDPAWDILLELYAAELGQQRVTVTDVGVAADVPATTALRWLRKLEQDGLVERTNDRFDGRRVWLTLSTKGSSAMRRYFDAVARGSLPL
jgi:DNA-binding MarR family transcriptional regulator